MLTLSNPILQAGRIALGAGLWVAPQITSRVWLRDSQSTRVALRGLGVRDVALGFATIKAQGGNQNTYRALLMLGMLADLTDCVATATNKQPASRLGQALVVTLAGAAALNGVLLIKESLKPDPLLIP